MNPSLPHADGSNCAIEDSLLGADVFDADVFDDDMHPVFARGAPPRVFGRFRRAREATAEVLGLLGLLAVLLLLGIVGRAKKTLDG